MKKRLSKVLAAAGVASRRGCEELIFSGRITLNGEIVKIPQTLVSLESDKITCDGELIKREEPKVCYLLNKPPGLICSSIAKGKKVIDLFAHLPYRLFTVGRLDKDTSGLILVTNDGQLANRVIHPSFNVSKEYLVKTQQEITADHLKALSRGATVEGMHIRPLAVKKVRRGTVKITVSEGKKHEVRLLVAAADLTLLELCRIRIGPLTLGNLPQGKYRELTPAEVRLLTFS